MTNYCLIWAFSLGTLDKSDPKPGSNFLQSMLNGSVKTLVSVSEAILKKSDNDISDDNSGFYSISEPFNFTYYAENLRKGNLSYIGSHVTVFDNNECKLDETGSRARVFWLWKTSR